MSFLTLGIPTKAEVYAELASKPLKLKALCVEQGNDSSGQLIALEAMLTESQQTLKTLEFRNFSQRLDKLPTFTKLEKLHFEVDTKSLLPTISVSTILPNLSDSLFPNLKMIHFDFGDTDVSEGFIREHFWETCATPLETVDKLQLGVYCDPLDLKYLAKIFPRVTHI